MGEIETRAFNAEQALKWINSTVQAHNLLFKDGKLKSDLFPSEEKLMTTQGMIGSTLVTFKYWVGFSHLISLRLFEQTGPAAEFYSSDKSSSPRVGSQIGDRSV